MVKWLGVAGLMFSTLTASPLVLSDPVRINGGEFEPPVLLDKERLSIEINSFMLDATPVTNQLFLDFVKNHPKWQRDNIAALFHDGNYLKHWPQNNAYPDGQAEHPVTYVSWFAAREYCAAQGGRLPSLNEWEYASVQYRQQQNISDDDYARDLFAWYSQPQSDEQRVNVNATELSHMYDRVNEWVEDYQLLLTNGDDVDLLSGSCGDGARFLSSFTKANYATFFRYQSRSDYAPQSSTSTMGFRCAYDISSDTIASNGDQL